MAAPKTTGESPNPTTPNPTTPTASTLSAAQVAAGAYELQPARQKPEDSFWGELEAQGGALIAHAQPDLDYRFLLASEYPADGRQLYEHRQALVNRGFEAISGPLYKGPARPEHVPGQSTAEVWARPRRFADEEFRVRLARSCLNETFAKIYHRRCVAEGAPQKRYLPEALEYAMLVHHDLLTDTRGIVRQPGRTRDIAAERRLITSLARVAPVHPHADRRDPVREAIAAAQKG